MIYAGIATFVLLSAAFPLVVSYLIDVRLHEGVGWFTRRHVLRTGVAAKAKVLSMAVLPRRLRYQAPHSVVYEVMPEGQPPFRAKGIEVMTTSEAVRAREGTVVDVRFDPARKVVVLVRVDAAQLLAEREAARIEREKKLLGGP